MPTGLFGRGAYISRLDKTSKDVNQSRRLRSGGRREEGAAISAALSGLGKDAWWKGLSLGWRQAAA